MEGKKGLRLYDFIIYSGIAAFVFMTIAIVLAAAGISYNMHKVMGIIAFAFALLHMILIVYKTLKLKLKRRQA